MSSSLAVRVIPCLDVDAGRVVKGVNFADLRDAGDPVELATRLRRRGRRRAHLPRHHRVARRPRDHLRRRPPHRRAGVHPADRRRRRPSVETSTGCCAPARTRSGSTPRRSPARSWSPRSRDRFGSQVLVLSVDARRCRRVSPPSGFEVTTHGGRRGTGLDAVEWARAGAELGAGEILLNSMDADGTKAGYDLEMIAAVRAVVDVPLIASGGAGRLADFPPAVDGRRRRGAGGERLPLRRPADRRGQGRPCARRATPSAEFADSSAEEPYAPHSAGRETYGC